MSYLLIIIVGAIVGYIAGQYIKGNEHGVGVDVLAGGLGACLAVLLSRIVGPAAAAGWFMSTIIAGIGAVVVLYAVRQVIKPKPVPAARISRRF
jgi:uncharacterized membrane protein YeaQ/YmgE (transglycosylase-associated protein family)